MKNNVTVVNGEAVISGRTEEDPLILMVGTPGKAADSDRSVPVIPPIPGLDESYEKELQLQTVKFSILKRRLKTL